MYYDPSVTNAYESTRHITNEARRARARHAQLPGAIAAPIGAHIYLVTRLGITAPPWQKAASGDGIREERV